MSPRRTRLRLARGDQSRYGCQLDCADGSAEGAAGEMRTGSCDRSPAYACRGWLQMNSRFSVSSGGHEFLVVGTERLDEMNPNPVGRDFIFATRFLPSF